MGDASESYKIATEAGREAVKQLIVVTGGLLAGYLAFTGRTETAKILDVEWARCIIATLCGSLFLAAFSLALTYLMHAARSQSLFALDPSTSRHYRRWQTAWEIASLITVLAAFGGLLGAIVTIGVTSYF